MPQTLPPKIDFYALWIFLGIIQALFLAYFFIVNKQHNRLTNRFLGFLLLSFAAALTEILLCYTNYMFRVIWLIDFAEPTNFLFAPLIYLYHRSYLQKTFKKLDYLHFLPFIFYVFYKTITFYIAGFAAKYNAYIGSYHRSELVRLPEKGYLPNSAYILSNYVNELMLVQMCIYVILGFWMLKKEADKEQISFWSSKNPDLAWCRKGTIYSVLAIIVFVSTKLLFENDLGDHFIATYLTLIIYGISFILMNKSTFFDQKTTKKYEKSSLTNEIQENTLGKLQALMQNEKPFLSASFSLPLLAKKLGISQHHLSQILNESLGQSFFDFTAQHRVEEARLLLKNKETAHLKIEEIGERVGYNSKSAFNTAFKKFVGMTPSEFKLS
jgi:AraC-like DNA-binding protein